MPHRAGHTTPGVPDPEEGLSGDALLLAAAREGDDAAFGELYERHRAAVLAVARLHARNEADAQDLVSEAFTRVLALLREGRGPREFLRAYLVTAVSRLAADRANDLTRTRLEPPRADGPLDRVEFFDDVVERQVDSAVVARAFASLPERWQEVLWYLEVEGRRPRQVASVVGAQPNAVSALAKRAREGLRTAYVQEHVSARALEECHRYSSQLGAFARGSLSPSRTRAVQEHLDECPRCTAEYLQLQDLGLGLRGWVLPVMAGLPLWTGAGEGLARTLGGLPFAPGVSQAADPVHPADGAGGPTDPSVPGGTGTGGGTRSVGSSIESGKAVAASHAGVLATAGAVAVVALAAVGFAAAPHAQQEHSPAAVTSQTPSPRGEAPQSATGTPSAVPSPAVSGQPSPARSVPAPDRTPSRNGERTGRPGSVAPADPRPARSPAGTNGAGSADSGGVVAQPERPRPPGTTPDAPTTPLRPTQAPLPTESGAVPSPVPDATVPSPTASPTPSPAGSATPEPEETAVRSLDPVPSPSPTYCIIDVFGVEICFSR